MLNISSILFTYWLKPLFLTRHIFWTFFQSIPFAKSLRFRAWFQIQRNCFFSLEHILNSIVHQIIHHGMWRPPIFWVNSVSFSHTLFNEIASDIHKLVVNCYAFLTGLPICTCHRNFMHKLAPLGSGRYVDQCGDCSVFFYIRHVDGNSSILFQFCPKAKYFQNNDKKMLEMWNQNSVFKSLYIITM